MESYLVFYSENGDEYFQFAQPLPQLADSEVEADSTAPGASAIEGAFDTVPADPLTDTTASPAAGDEAGDAASPLTMPLDFVNEDGFKSAEATPGDGESPPLEIAAVDAADTFFNPDPFIY